VVNYRLGWVKALSTGTITNAQALLADYAYTAATGTTVSGGTKAQIKARLVLDGKNDNDGKSCIVRIPEAQLSPASGLDFQAAEWGKLEMTGRMKKLPGQDPFFIEMMDA
jgi:hypothetical protein